MDKLKNKLKNNLFTYTVELDPPHSSSAQKIISEAKTLKELVDAINIADCPMAKLRMSPIALAHIIQNDVGIETIFHLTCRDRNIIGLQAELLGAAGLKVENILTLTGDSPTQGDHPSAKAVFETDSLGLIKIAKNLNDGYSFSGHKLEEKTHFFIGSAVNPSADDLAKEIDKLKAKVAAGIHFAQTQPIYDLNIALRFLELTQNIPIYILIGILPLKSYKMACYLHEKVPGITIPTKILRQMEVQGKQAGIDISINLINQIKKYCHGVHIMPLNELDLVKKIIHSTKCLNQ